MTLDLAQVRKIERMNGELLRRIEELEGDNATLRKMLSGMGPAVPGTEGLNLTNSERTILGALHARHGHVVSKGALHDVLYQLSRGQGERNQKIVDVMLVRLRRKLASTQWRIETVWGEGVKLVKTQSEVAA